MFTILKPGGYLINLGPLLYHFDDHREAPSVELTWEEVREVVIGLGFIVVVRGNPELSTCIVIGN